MNKNLIKQIIIDQKALFNNYDHLIPRKVLEKESIDDLLKIPSIVVITGIRRCGKSSLLRLISNELKKQKIQDSNLLYINFDDERFIDFKNTDFNTILEIYYELYPDTKDKIYLFLDEIQNRTGWEKWLNRLYETKKYKIFVTGSNASLLSSEISTALTGRNYTIELYPFSFTEFLKFKKVSFEEKDIYLTEKRAKLNIFLSEYLKQGGFPEILTSGNPNLLHNIYKDILFRDIISRYNIGNVHEFRELVLYLISNTASLASYNNLAKILNIKSPNSVMNYMHYLKEGYFLFEVKKFDPSYKKQLINPKKIYTIDNGFIYHIGFAIDHNQSKLFENLVYLHLKRLKNSGIFYYKTKKNREIDFIVKEKNTITDVIQVCSDIRNPETLEREKIAMIESLDEFKKRNGIIITDAFENEEKINNKTIHYIPLLQWLLQNNN